VQNDNACRNPVNVIFQDVFLMMDKLVLASQSPRRKQLLEWAEVKFEINSVHSDEIIKDGLTPSEVAVDIAMQKANAVRQHFAERTILAADTIVVLGNDIIGKPKDREDAISILNRLSGKHHQVITGVVLTKGNLIHSFADVTDVLFHPLTQEQIIFYVEKYKPYDKAGAYAIQEWIGVTGIKSIHGDFYNVMGLPVSRVLQSLWEFSPEIMR
jgi:septum formation protein